MSISLTTGIHPSAQSRSEPLALDPDARLVYQLLGRAKRGDVDAQVKLADTYYCALHGVTKDTEQARFWLERAARNDHAKALVMLGELYEEVDSNFEAAATLYQRASDLGDGLASNSLGRLYSSGKGVGKNLEKAFKCFQKSARQGSPSGYCTLGQMYVKKLEGVIPKNLIRASFCYFEAAAIGKDEVTVKEVAERCRELIADRDFFTLDPWFQEKIYLLAKLPKPSETSPFPMASASSLPAAELEAPANNGAATHFLSPPQQAPMPGTGPTAFRIVSKRKDPCPLAGFPAVKKSKHTHASSNETPS